MLFLYELVKDSFMVYANYVERMVMDDENPLLYLLVKMWFLVVLPGLLIIGTTLVIGAFLWATFYNLVTA